ncbi:exodeoxyribonuclease V subunit beta [Gallibacterium melopsittaci]|uniref:RecBCD enzyme subunit RecB n=1 Tax=Gallibacterium melopsittaci TaxID=516063 RepID=A0ABV6HYE0_9PAST
MKTQLNPISLPLAQNNVIEASAGTGKTYTMVTLYLRLLLQAGENNFPQPLDIEQILVVTFTKDATKELRQRINQRIQLWLKQLQQYQQQQDKTLISDQELLKLLPFIEANLPLAIQRLTFASQYIDRAAIFTIHSFCQRILRQYAFDSGLSFEFSVGEKDKERLRQINYQLWREQFYSLDSEQAEYVVKLFGSPDKVFDKFEKLLSGEMPQITQKLLFDDLASGLAYYQQQLAKFKSIEAAYLADFKVWYEHKNSAIQKVSLKRIQSYLTPEKDIELQLKKAKQLTEIKFYKGEVISLPSLILELEKFFTQFSQETYVASMNYLYIQLLRERLFSYQDSHNEKNFDDLLRLLRDALYKPQAEKLIRLIRQQYPFAMIDEFQDTDPIQLAIFEKIYLITKPDYPLASFTVIGDPKQAIYRFRGADIFTYLSVMDSQREHSITNVYTLQHNYRSAVGLIESLNQLYTQAENPFYLKNIEFPPIQAHNQGYLEINGAKQPAWQMLQLAEEHKKRESYQRAIAEMYANYLQQLLKLSEQQQAYFVEDPENAIQRKIAAQDIAILVRNGKESQIIRTALAKKGIASVYLSENSNVFDSVIAQNLYLVLQACFTPFNERAVLSAIGSTLWAFSAAEIYQLKENEEQWAELIERLLVYRHIWQTQGVLPMLYKLFQTEKIPQRLQQFELGERYLVDLLHLSELLQQAMNQQQNEEALLNWYQQQLSDKASTEENRLRLEREQEVIKIITIHKSKGLEFPLVCLPFIMTPSDRITREDVSFYHNGENQLIWDIAKTENGQVDLENRAENMRLLYVALTRAKYQLIVGVPSSPFPQDKTTIEKLTPLDYLLVQGETLATESSYLALFDRALSSENWQILNEIELLEYDPWRPNLFHQQAITVQTFEQNIEKNWRVTSFTALQARLQAIYNEHFIDLAQDYIDQEVQLEAEVLAEPSEQLSAALYPVNFSPFDFPKGANVGECLHRYLENLNFTQPIELESFKPLCQLLNLTDDWLIPLQTWFTQLVNKPLPELGALQQISYKDKLMELQFYLKLGKLFNNQKFNQILHQYHPLYDQQYPIQIDEIQGFIRGFIDLVVRYNNRYYIIDYKSNFLGDKLSYYQPDNLQKVISSQRYDLQYLIYTLALHRYLKLRDPEYQYATHFGGVFYLFLRGMAVADHSQTGIFFTKPATELIEKLDQLWE